jgi:hypothetical protein
MQILPSSPNASVRLDMEHKACQSSLTQEVATLQAIPTVFLSDFLADPGRTMNRMVAGRNLRF